MILVLDANAGIEIALDREKAESIHVFVRKASKIITSDLYKAETTNVLYKYLRAGLLDSDSAREKLDYCHMLIDDFFDIDINKEESLMESVRLKHSVYDLLYLTLARRHGAWLISLDKKLNALATDCGINCMELDQ